MKKYLTYDERAKILMELSKKQRKTLFLVVGKRYRSYFADLLAKYKGTRDWSFYLYIDHGKVCKDIKCQCGKPLRHQYILINNKTKEKRTIGSTHFIEELQIPGNIAKEVLQGFHNINYDLDELLQKYHNSWDLPNYIKKYISLIKVPREIEKLLEMELPLLESHLKLLYAKITRHRDKAKKKETYLYTLPGYNFQYQYEIKNKEIYEVLIEKISFDSYIEPFKNDIHRFLLNRGKSAPLYDLIHYLVGLGLPNEMMYGQHALTKKFREYFAHAKRLLESKRTMST